MSSSATGTETAVEGSSLASGLSAVPEAEMAHGHRCTPAEMAAAADGYTGRQRAPSDRPAGSGRAMRGGRGRTQDARGQIEAAHTRAVGRASVFG